jgi:hypothetical protein
MRELGRRSGKARGERALAAKGSGPPFTGTILDAMELAGPTGLSWAVWRVFLAALFALPMAEPALEVFRRHTGRTTPPTSPVREAWPIVGRRGGKSRIAALVAMYLGSRRNYRELLAPGEQAVIAVLAADRKQARQVLGYLKGLARLPAFASRVARVLKEAVELGTGVTIEVHTASYRTVRGYTIVAVVADEVAFWRSDESANPDTEVLNALRPGMATVPGALLLGLSTPYARRGELYKAHQRYFGLDGSDVLVWVAPSLEMNPTLNARVIEQAYEEDPAAAAAEWGAAFRSDVEAFLSLEAVDAARVRDRLELAPAGHPYVAFVDPSGGSRDSFTLAIAHADGERAVLDAVREIKPPFSPDDVCREFAALLKTYHVYSVHGDHYAGEWPRERFTVHGIDYLPAEQTKSDLYAELLPLVNAGRAELLDVPALRGQLLGLERRTARSGRDSIDHAPGGHDDVANAVAGALVLAQGGPRQVTDIRFPVFLREDA